MAAAVAVGQIRRAVQVPDPDAAVRWPEPVVRLMPLDRVTLKLPASATWPDALITALDDATLPLVIPIETLAPLGQAASVEAI